MGDGQKKRRTPASSSGLTFCAAAGLVRGPARPRPRAAGLHRRDRGLDQDGPAYGRAGAAKRCRAPVPHGHWKTTTFVGALRLDWHDRAHGPRRRHARSRLPGLCRAGPGSDTESRRHRRHGQPASPQTTRPIARPSSTAGARAPLPAALQSWTSTRSRWPSPRFKALPQKAPPHEPSRRPSGMRSVDADRHAVTPDRLSEDYFTAAGYEPE